MPVIKKYYARRKPFSLDSTCNNGCGCSRSEFSPICGVDGITYYSPCHAGCYQGTRINNVEVSSDFFIALCERRVCFSDAIYVTLFPIFAISTNVRFEDISTSIFTTERTALSYISTEIVLSYVQSRSFRSSSQIR